MSQASGVSRGVAFENFLLASIKALAYPTMEHKYLQAIKKYESGEVGERYEKDSSAGYFHDRTWAVLRNAVLAKDSHFCVYPFS